MNNDFLNETAILLPTRGASSGVAVNKTEYAVVDGMTPYIYIFSFCGMYKGAVPTLRPYRKLVYSMDDDIYYSLGCNCSSDIYTLNCRFEETDKIRSEATSRITDISLSESGELILSQLHSVNAFTRNGTLSREIRKQNYSLFYNGFVETESGSAEGVSKNDTEHIRLTINGDEISAVIPTGTTLKNLFSTDGGGIYGFFGKNYVNNYIVPLYENESFNASFFLKSNF